MNNFNKELIKIFRKYEDSISGIELFFDILEIAFKIKNKGVNIPERFLTLDMLVEENAEKFMHFLSNCYDVLIPNPKIWLREGIFAEIQNIIEAIRKDREIQTGKDKINRLQQLKQELTDLEKEIYGNACEEDL